jgi:hypothetical protein
MRRLPSDSGASPDVDNRGLPSICDVDYVSRCRERR